MKISVAIDINAIVRQLPLREKIRLSRQLEKETWASELNSVVGRIRSRSSVRQLSMRDITQIVEDVRKKGYARTTRRS